MRQPLFLVKAPSPFEGLSDKAMTDLVIPEAFLPLWNEHYEHYAFYGGRGGGKSHGIAEACLVKACIKKERVVCGRQFQVSIKDSVKELLEQKIHSMNMAVFWKSTDAELTNLSTGSRFSFIGMDRNPEGAKSLEGATIFWGEEAQAFTPRSIEIIVPTVRAPGSRMMWSWNPRFRTDEVDAMFRGGHPPDNSYVKQVSWRDNPFFYQTRMPSERIRAFKAKKHRYPHVWEGAYDESPESSIFNDHRVGRVSIPDKCFPRFGMDFGYGSDPNVLIKLYIIEELRVIYVAQEAYGYKISNKNLSEFMDQVTEVRDHQIVADSSRPETIDYLVSEGFNVIGARKGAGSIRNGINFLDGYEIVVDPDCPNVYDEIRNYRWKSDPQGKPLPIPAERQPDHGIDAMRYAVEDASIHSGSGQGGGVVYV